MSNAEEMKYDIPEIEPEDAEEPLEPVIGEPIYSEGE